MSGNPEFSNDEYIQRKFQFGCYFESHGDAAAWEREYDRITVSTLASETLGEQSTGFYPVFVNRIPIHTETSRC